MTAAPDPLPTHQRGPWKAAWYGLSSFSLWVAWKGLYRLRVCHADRVPPRGPVLLLANHTSPLDPPLIGGATRRQLSFMARDTLFVGAFAWLIRSYDAIPVDRDGGGLGGVRATLKRLKQGGAVLLFPEGTRSPDGALQPFKPGFVALVRRGKAAVVPVGIAGAHEAWPRGASRPRLSGRVAVWYGEPISPAEVAGCDDQLLVALAERRVAECVEAARQAVVTSGSGP